MEQILGKNQTIRIDALKSQVEEEITKAGFTRMGFSLRFKEAMADSKFKETSEGVRLSESK